MDAGTVLRRARLRQGLTQAQVARSAGTSQPVISAYEQGHRDPTVGTLRRLVAATGERLQIDSASSSASDLPPPVDAHEHATRLVSVLSLADAIPSRPPWRPLSMPRIVSG